MNKLANINNNQLNTLKLFFFLTTQIKLNIKIQKKNRHPSRVYGRTKITCHRMIEHEN